MKNKMNFKGIFQFLLNKSKKDTITIVILIGVLLLVISLPIGKNKSGESKENTGLTSGLSESSNGTSDGVNNNMLSDTTTDAAKSYETNLEDKIEQILSKADGVGKVKVVVSLKNTSEKILAEDSNYSEENVSETDSAGGSRVSGKVQQSNTNIYSESNNGNQPYVKQENMPEVEGVVVVAQGGGDGTIASNITSAVEALLGVPAHKIKVLKMS